MRCVIAEEGCESWSVPYDKILTVIVTLTLALAKPHPDSDPIVPDKS